MKHLEPMRRKDANAALESIEKQYGEGCALHLIDEYSFFISPKNKIQIVSNTIRDVPLDKLHINNIGLYFCELNPGGIRLSIEGSQLIGKKAISNSIEFDNETASLWLKGEDIAWTKPSEGFQLIKNNYDFLGSAKYRDGKLLNFIPKARRIQCIIE